MTLKEEFLNIKTYEEYKPISSKFKNMPLDAEVLAHYDKLMEIPENRRAVEDGLHYYVKH